MAAPDLFTFVLDGARFACDLSSGWQRRKRALQGGLREDFGEFDQLVLAEAKAACKRRAALTGYPWAIDHMIPLRRGGSHAWDNLQVIPSWINGWKGDRMILTRTAEYAYLLPGGSPTLFENT